MNATDDATIGDLLASAGHSRSEVTWTVSGQPLASETTLTAAGVRDGTRLAVGAAPGFLPPPLPAPGTMCLAIVCGPGAGMVVPLREGTTDVGRGAHIRIPGPDISRRHFRMTVTSDGVVIEDAGSTNGTYVDGVEVKEPTHVVVGSMIEVGQSVLSLVVASAADRAAADDGEAGIAFNRGPRLLPPRQPARIKLPTPPAEPPRRSWPVAMIVLPLAVGVIMAVIIGPYFLIFALLSPAMLISNMISDRRHNRKAFREASTVYRRDLAAAKERYDQARAVETVARRREQPDPVELMFTASGPGRRLWERHRHDPDFLDVRVGLADLPSETRFDRPTADMADGLAETPLHAVPAVVALREAGVLGVAGPTGQACALARWIVAQMAVLHSPIDLQFMLLIDKSAGTGRRAGRSRARGGPARVDPLGSPGMRASDSAGDDVEDAWSWFRWLPHARPPPGTLLAGSDYVAAVGADSPTVERRLEELRRLLDSRAEQVHRLGAAVLDRLPAVLVIMDGARSLRALPGVVRLLEEGPALGVVFVCLDEQEAMLPRECGAALVFDAPDESAATLQREGCEPVPGVLADLVDSVWAQRVARALAPVRDVERRPGGGEIPSAVRLLDLIQLEPPTSADVLVRWAAGGHTTRVVLGVTASGHLNLDLRDGPHLLIAGTSGSGKSGLLQTLVTSLAAANRPDALSFVLVDYKGGAAFRGCERLPHTVGLVTDLDPSLTERALVSLRAELRRREHLLKAAGKTDAEQYWRALATAPASTDPMPRLVICVDEFAELAQELPDFIAGMVGVAATGRSLGVHLVLATQRPAGVVSEKIKANVNIKIALWMADDANSSDVIDAPDAHRMPRIAGRAVVRIGGEGLIQFQAGRIDGPRPGAKIAGPPVTSYPVPWPDVGRPTAPATAVEPERDGERDIDALVAAIGEAAAQLGIPAQRSPWLPPLPFSLLLSDLDSSVDGVTRSEIPFGIEDIPELQCRRTVVIDLEHGGNLLVAGTARSGRTTMLRTIAGSLARMHSPDDVHLYAIDGGGSGLAGLTALPHCGAVVPVAENDRVERLVNRLTAELRSRRGLLAQHNVATIAELPPGVRPPYLVVLLDGFDAFAGAFDQADQGTVADLLALVRDALGAGFRFVIAGDRMVFAGRLISLVPDRLVLRLADRPDYQLAGVPFAGVPLSMPPGRALRAGSGTAVQVALLDADHSGRGQAAALAGIAAHVSQAYQGRLRRPAFRVDALPHAFPYAQARKLGAAAGDPVGGPAARAPTGASVPLIGVGGDELGQVRLDLSVDGPGLLILGPRRSGRSTALAVMANSLAESGARLVMLMPRADSPLGDLVPRAALAAAERGVEAVRGFDLAGALTAGPTVVLVDDLDLVHDTPLALALAATLAGAAGTGHAVVAGASDALGGMMSGLAATLGRGGTGVVLCPTTTIPGLVFGAGIRLPRSMVGALPPGRAVLLVRGHPTPVQIPLLKAES